MTDAIHPPTVPSEADRERLRAHLDRGLTPRASWVDSCPEFNGGPIEWWPVYDGFEPWRDWFADGECLGTRSARVGPDPVNAAQHCPCEQCRPDLTTT